MRDFFREYWSILVPLALGMWGIYWLLPRVRNSWTLGGAVAAVLGLVTGGFLLIRSEGFWVETFLFFAFSGLAILGAGFMIAQKNPVHAALSFALVVLSTCGLFLLQAAPFLMAATIIIYAGAIVVTFLFVIMLAQQAGLSGADQRSREPFLASLAGFILLTAILCLLHKNYDTRGPDRDLAELEKFLGPIRKASIAKNLEEIQEILGKDSQAIKQFQEYYEEKIPASFKPRDKEKADKLIAALDNLQEKLTLSDFPGAVDQLKIIHQEGQEFAEKGRKMRHRQGSLQADSRWPLSRFSGLPANADPPAEGKDRLPAENVAALGRSLFTDYLLGVELAAVLLLVAPIGAIAIAARRTDSTPGGRGKGEGTEGLR